jgi:hypothetical protein
MIRAVSLIVVLALTAPSAATLACEWLFCAGAHHDATAKPGDCHDHDATDTGPAWSGIDTACHDAADGIAEAVVRTGSTLVSAPPAVAAILTAAPGSTPHSNALPRSGHGPPASLHATTPLRI